MISRLSGVVSAAAIVLTLGVSGPASAQDAAAGAKAFGRCKACHTLDEGGRSAAGPNLFGFLGAPSGSRDVGFRYSKQLTEAALEWTDETLDQWLAGPRDLVKGTRMTLKVANEQQRQDLIAYLKEATE